MAANQGNTPWSRWIKGAALWDVLEELRRCLPVGEVSPAVLRRNVVVEALDLNALVGGGFSIQGVEFGGAEGCRPCYWMDSAIGPGAEAALTGRGGLRARILSTGWLRRQADSR